MAADTAGSRPAGERPAERIVQLEGLEVRLSAPILVAKREAKPLLCYPRVFRLADGEALLTIWLGGDNYGVVGDGQQGFCWSADGGKTWTQPHFVPKNSGNRGLVLPSGDFVLLPYALYPLPGGMGGPYYRIAKGRREVTWVKEGAEFTGWPRPDRSYSPRQGITGFVCHGGTLRRKDGGYVGTLYGRFEDAKQDSLTLFESADGLHWRFRSLIWDGKSDPLPGMTEGANESAMIVQRDGRLMCVFRGVGGRLSQTWSEDEGKTWSRPVRAAVPGDVEPSLAGLGGGALALASGRRMDLSINLDGLGKDWQSVSLMQHHNHYYPEDDPKGKGIYGWGTSGYPNVISLDDSHLLYVYDRWLNSGSSIWAVRVSVQAAGRGLFVATTGDDGADGSKGRPFKSIQAAADKAQPGDVITVLAGQYAERVQVRRSGRQGSPIVFQADGRVVMRGFTVKADWVTLRGFGITDTADHWKEGWGICVEGSHCLIENNHVWFAASGGIMLWADVAAKPALAEATSNCIVRGNRLERNAMAGVAVHGRNHLIENNEVFASIQHHPAHKVPRQGADADGMRFFGSGHVFRGNYIHDIKFGPPENVDPHIDGFQTWSGKNYEAASNVLFERNIVELLVSQRVRENGHGFMLQGCRDLAIRNNIIKAFGGVNTGAGNTRNITIVNNLFISDLGFPLDRHPCGVGLEDSPGAIVMNNIFYQHPSHTVYVSGGGDRTGQRIGHNLVFRGDGGKPIGSPRPGDRWQVNPKFADPEKGDFHLQPGSPAIDAGATINQVTDDFDGNKRPAGEGFDIGPFEHLPREKTGRAAPATGGTSRPAGRERS